MRDNHSDSKTVAVIVVSMGRSSLSAAIESIAAQDYAGSIETLLLLDGGQLSPFALTPQLRSGVSWAILQLEKLSNEESPVARIARLRNAGVCLTKSSLLAFLDDDNAWLPDHLSSLIRLMQDSDSEAVHSWRSLELPDGTPWVPDAFPWLTPGTHAERHLFSTYRQLGVLQDDNIVRDEVTMSFENHEYGMVDMGEWLFRRHILQEFPFETEYSRCDINDHVTEDDKLLIGLRKAGIRTSCTSKPTLKYRLGGFSNKFCQEGMTE